MSYLLFTGGGSAGHVVPNLALIEALQTKYPVAYMGTGGIEKKLLSAYDIPFYEVNCPKFRRKVTLSNLTIPFSLFKAVRRAEELLRENPPALIFSKGGYASFPAVWAGSKLKIPVLTHESDISAGLCTKLIAKKCEYVLTSFPETAEQFQNGLCVGSPIRCELLSGNRALARRKYGFTDKKPVLLTLGGGSGARALNEFIQKNLNALLPHFQILHLCGAGNLPSVTARGYVCLEYERDMASAYAAADCALARAGSNTAFELLALKKPALFVPLEKGSRGDQLLNARSFEKRGLCRVLREQDLLQNGVSQLKSLVADERLKEALSLEKITSGTEKTVALVEKLLRNRGIAPK